MMLSEDVFAQIVTAIITSKNIHPKHVDLPLLFHFTDEIISVLAAFAPTKRVHNDKNQLRASSGRTDSKK